MTKTTGSGIATPRRQNASDRIGGRSMTALRLALFSSVAAGSLMLAGPAALANSCLLDGTTVTCTGDVSSGIYLTDPAIDVNVHDVTTDINPASISGINIQTTDYIHANVQLDEHKIDVDWSDVDGHVASGIVLNAAADDKSADLTFQGTIISDKGYGILVDGWAGGAVTSTGDITAKLDAINVHSAYSGKASVESDGALTSTDGYGVRADGIGSVVVDLSGSVNSYLDGVKATATGEDDDATVRVVGNAAVTSSNGYGIYADSSYHSVVVDYDGSVTGQSGGIFAWAHGEATDASATVTIDGDVNSSGGAGIWADSSYHSAAVYSTGTVEAEGDGINVRTHGDNYDASTTISQNGNVTSHSGSGIIGVSDFHSATIDSIGDINAYVDGLVAKTHGTDSDASSDITSVGSVTATTGYGIYALSDNHSASVTSNGAIEANLDGIYVVTHGDNYDANSTIKQTGNVTSHAGTGLYALSDFGAASIEIYGDTSAQNDGIVAVTHGSDGNASSTIKSVGSVTATTGTGIYALSDYHSASVDSDGAIEAQGDGISVVTHGDNYDASSSVKQNGNVTSYGGSGVVVLSDFQSATIWVKGDVVAQEDGLSAISHGSDYNASAQITSIGSVTATNGYGIHVLSDFHAAKVDSTGNVEAGDDAILVTAKGNNYDASATLNSIGDVTSHNGRGLVATSAFYAATIKSKGVVSAYGDAIVASSTGTDSTASAIVDQNGNVSSSTGYGIYASSSNQAVNVTLVGEVEAAKDAIRAISLGNSYSSSVHVTSNGKLTSHDGYGIYATSANRNVTVLNTGDIDAYLTGLYARSTGDNEDASVLITQNGDIGSTTGLGIYAESTNRGVVITSTGDITAKTGGITAKSTGSVASSTIHVTNVGDISLTGSSGSGIYGYASNREVSISQKGDVSGGDYGLNAKSEGSSVDITLLDGTISDTDLAGVLMDSISGNVFNNHGTVNSGDGVAILAKGWGGTTINNYGTVNGDVTVEDIWGRFNNYGDAVYNIGSIDFQKGGVLYNYGTLSPGGDGNISVATITGSYVNQGGTIVIDIDGEDSDRIDVSGTASLDGTVKLNYENVKGLRSYTVLTSAELIDQGLELSLEKSLLNQDSTISYVDGTDVVVNLNLTYDLQDVAEGNSGIARALQNAYLDEDAGMGEVLAALANLETMDEYNAALEQLAGENYTQDTSTIRIGNMAFTNRLFSCKVQDGTYAFSAEGECGWVSIAAGSFDRSSDMAGFDYSENSQQLAAGAQFALGDDWRLGGAVGYTQFQGSNGLGATTDGEQYEIGGVLKYDREGTIFATAVSLGTTTADSVRTISFGGLDETLTGQATAAFAALRFQTSHTFDYGDFYLKPMADLNLTKIHQDEFVEEGGDAALDIAAHDQFIASVDPSLEIGGQVKLNETAELRPFIRAGFSVVSGGDGEITASFVDGDGTTFTIANSDDQLLGKVSAGADLLGVGDGTARLYYEGTFGETTKRQTIGVKLGMSF